MRSVLLLLFAAFLGGAPTALAAPPHISKTSSKPLKIEEELVAFWDDLREHNATFRKQFDELTRTPQAKYGEFFDASQNRIPQVVPWWPLRYVYGINFMREAEGTYLVTFAVGSGHEMAEAFDSGLVAQFHVRYHTKIRFRAAANASETPHEEMTSNTLELTFEGFRQSNLGPAIPLG